MAATDPKPARSNASRASFDSVVLGAAFGVKVGIDEGLRVRLA
jgi:hypothetical protein